MQKLEEIAFEMSRAIRNDENGTKEIYIDICERCHAKELIELRDIAYEAGYVLHTNYQCLFKCGSETVFCKYNDEIIEAKSATLLWEKIVNAHKKNISTIK